MFSVLSIGLEAINGQTLACDGLHGRLLSLLAKIQTDH